MLGPLVFTGLATPTAWAQRAETPTRIVSLIAENDSVTGADRDYTNGMRASVLTLNTDQSGVSGFVGRRLLGARLDDRVYGGFAFGHMIYTPAWYGWRNPPEDQHPYAGFAFVDAETLRRSPRVLERATLQLGLVGPSAGGEDVQSNWHDFTSSEQPRGWDNQLEDEVTLGLSYERIGRTRSTAAIGRGADLITAAGGVVGSALTQAHIAAMVRYGEDLGNDFGPSRVQPGFSGGDVFEPFDQSSWSLFAGVQAKAVAHNIVLDGNTTVSNGPSVEREPFVLETQTGASWQRGDARLSFLVVARSREYATQKAGQVFAALSVSRRL